jgi:hypothetical protein
MSCTIEGSPATGWLILRKNIIAGSIVLLDEHYHVEILWLGSDIKYKTDSWDVAEAYVHGACEILNRTYFK